MDRLVELSTGLPRKSVPLSEICELDHSWYAEGERRTWRSVAEHTRLVEEADLSFPIILSSNGTVMDGMHRVLKAFLQGRREIQAVQFEQDPEPDHIGISPDDLPY